MHFVAGDDLLELELAGYEFPMSSRPEPEDAAWLMVRGRIQRSGEAWRFREPCLTVWEARRLFEWLRDESALPIEFLEPLLAFARHTESDGRIRVTVRLCAAAAPPSMPEESRWDEGCELTFLLSPSDLAGAAAEWQRHVDAHPGR